MLVLAPTIVFVPGLWEGPTVFAKVSHLLQAKGFNTLTVTLPSTGTSSPGNPDMYDDEAAIRTVVQELVEEGKQVLMVLHSAGGFLGSAAIEGLTAASRMGSGKDGGVVRLVFLSAGIAEVGYQHVDLPFMEFDNGKGTMTCVSPETTLFNGFSSEMVAEWLPVMNHQPASGWNSVTRYTAWREVPSSYLICESDRCLPEEVQEYMAELAGSKVERCSAGHMAMLEMPEKVFEIILYVVDGL